MHRFDQQPAHHGVALLADSPEPSPSAAGFLARIQPQITRDFLAATKTSYRTNGEHESQCVNGPDSRMRHQANRIFAALGFFQNGTIQLRDRSFELVEQLEKFFAPPAGPRAKCETCLAPRGLSW